MQIEQYQRKETPTGSAGNVISRQPNSYAELGRLGQTMTDIGFASEEQILKAQYHDEKTAAQLEFEKRSLEHEESLDPNNTDQWEADTNTFYKKAADEILSKMKNGKARDDASAWMEQEKLYRKKAISSYRRQVVAQNARAAYPINYRQSMETASRQLTPQEYDQSRLNSLRSVFHVELIDPEKPIGPDNLKAIEGVDDPLFHTDELKVTQAGAWLSDTEEMRDKELEKSQYKAGMMWVGIVPERAIEQLDKAISTGGKLKGYERLDVGQLRALKNIAEGTINDRKRRKTEFTESIINDIHKKAAQGVSFEEISRQIQETPGLDEEQRTNLMKEYLAATKVWAKTSQNPYTMTQDWNAAMEAYWKAEQGIPPDRKDVGSKYDVQWYEKLKKIAEGGGTAADFEDSSAAKFLKELIDDFGRRYSLYQEVPVMREKGYKLLQEAIASAKTPLTDREKKELALRIFNDLQSQPITTVPGALLTPVEQAEELGQSFDKAVAENIRAGAGTRQVATITQPKTQAEFDALPKGARYRRLDGTIWTKR